MTRLARVNVATTVAALAGLVLAGLVMLATAADAGWLSRRLYGPQGAQASEGADSGSGTASPRAGALPCPRRGGDA